MSGSDTRSPGDTVRLARQAAEAVDVDRLVDLTRRLVRVRSVWEPGSPEGNERAAAELVAHELRREGLQVAVEEAAAGRPNVIADWCGSRFEAGRHRTLMFEGHTDVVTEGESTAWRHPPFAAELIDGRIYGRGSADMKAGIAAAICALVAVKSVAPQLPGRIRLGIVADEEGMMLGIKSFIERGWAEGVDAAIICEPEENELCLHQKGALRVGAYFRGAMSHGAMPYAGVNPIPVLAAFVDEVGQLEGAEQKRLGDHQYLGLPWFTPTILRAPRDGEQQLNVMPGDAYVALDVRTVPGQDHADLLTRLRECGERARHRDPRVGVEIELIEERPWTETPVEEPLVAALARAYPLALGREARYGGVPGATDGTFLHAWARVPIVTVGPGSRTIPHQVDEYVEVAEVLEAARLYAAAAIEFLME